MVEFKSKVFIQCPPEEVFNFISDPANDLKYQKGLESSQWASDSPVGVGSIKKTTNTVMGRKIVSELELTAWQPPVQQTFKSIGGPVPLEMTAKVEPQDGGSLVIISGHAEAGGFFKLAEGLVGKQFGKQLDESTQTLKELLESGTE